MPSTYASAQANGIISGAADQTSAINAILANPGYSGIIMDVGGGAITINGTINANGKTILYYSGNYFTGGGAINGQIIDAGYRQQLFDTSISLTNCTVARKLFSVMWYGAKGDDTVNDQPAIQKTLDTVIANQAKIRTIFFPLGSYLINAPIIAYSWSGTKYLQVTVTLEGETDFAQTGVGSRINVSFTDTFAIGIQQGKSFSVKNLLFQGRFNPPAVPASSIAGYSWYSLTLDQFKDGVCRDNTYSPYTAIVIDPFTNGQAVPGGSGNQFPGLSTYYRGDGSNSGSTGTLIHNCSILNFVVGICSSPNAITRNAELTLIEKVQFGYCKVAISGSQDQEKVNKFYDIMCWANTHTIFATGVYGAQIPGNWYCELVNIAGNVNQLVYNNGLGYFPSHFEKIYAEGLGKIGYIGTNLQSSIHNSAIDFARPDNTSGLYDFQIDGYNTLFLNCSLRFYGMGLPIAIRGRHYFQNCAFEAAPYCPSELVSNQNQIGISVFTNCTVYNNNLGMQQEKFTQPVFFKGELIYGKLKTTDVIQYGSGHWETMEIDGGQSPTLEYWASIFNNPGLVTINIDSNRSAIVSVGAVHINKFRLNNIVVESKNSIIGIVTNINTTTNQITISYIPPGIISGNQYILGCVYPKSYYGAFLGDTAAGSNLITNVVFDKYGVDTTAIVGTLIELPFIGNFCFTSFYQNIVRILAYNASTRTITLDQPLNYTQVGAYIGFGEVKKTLKGGQTLINSFPAATLLTIRSEITISEVPGIEKRYFVTREGFLNAAGIGGGETRQAEWQELDPTEKGSGSADFALSIPAGYLVQGFVIKSTASFTITAGTTNGGTDISGGLPLTANVSSVMAWQKFADSGFTAYFNGITGSGGTTTIAAILKAL